MLFSAVGSITSTLDLGGITGTVEVVRALVTGHAVTLPVSQSHLASPCLAFLLLPRACKAELAKTHPLFIPDFLLASRSSLCPLSDSRRWSLGSGGPLSIVSLFLLCYPRAPHPRPFSSAFQTVFKTRSPTKLASETSSIQRECIKLS